MKQVRLTGKTMKGKTRISHSGNVWNILSTPTQLDPFPAGTLLLQSLDGRDMRWVTIEGDPNFTVEHL